MKKLSILLFFTIIACAGYSQSDVQFTHYMYNKLSYNPAYTGSKGTFDLLGLFRKQWTGIDGAPTTASFSLHAPFSDGRNAMGINLTADEIGKVKTTAIDLFYAYHIKINETSKLSIGLQGRIEQAKINWRKADPFDLVDDFIPGANESSFAPNFGLGAYYYSNNYFVGISVPRLLKNTLFLDRSGTEIEKASTLTSYVTAGVITKLTKNVKFIPSFLLTYNKNAPVDLDLNANFILMDKIIAGLSYRLADSVDGLIGFQFTNGMRLGMAMDFTTSELEKFTTGSFEIMLGYTFKCKDCSVNHLRYF
ncbi:MAG TPA: type IX secretion system membrane protein PorP/SprF [Bacteroidetes bacterium]|nr:type IX secretion system membrane protein PorP/SprF [Bacteroidota bacterium]